MPPLAPTEQSKGAGEGSSPGATTVSPGADQVVLSVLHGGGQPASVEVGRRLAELLEVVPVAPT